jgi:Secretion system C-terminal sorting domain
LKVYDVLGNEVASLVNTTQEAGTHSVKFDASKLASGLYVYTLNAGDFTSSKKMMLLK